MSSKRKRGVDEAEAASYKEFHGMTTTATTDEDKESKCPICLETLNDDNDLAVTSCGHSFHTSCLMQHAASQLRFRGTSQLYITSQHCTLCREPLYTSPKNDAIELLRLVSYCRWEEMHEHLERTNAMFDASIERDDYPYNVNFGMMPLHFAVRDHAPLAIIQEIYQAYPVALHMQEGCGLTPPELLEMESPNAGENSSRSYNEEEYAAVAAYLDSLLLLH